MRHLGDFDVAEELVAEAVIEALEHWPREGVPDRPGAWLLTTARRKALDRLRRESAFRQKLPVLAALQNEPPPRADDRLQLIFTCCHPALGREAQLSLTLRAVVGLTTEEIARAFLVPEPTVAKRILRAKQKIVAARIPYRLPDPSEFASRLDAVLTTIYLLFNEGYLATAGPQPLRRDLALDAEWLANLLVHLMPEQSEPLPLLALIRLHLARWPARLDTDGRLVLLDRQDRSRWDHRAIAAAIRLIERAAAMRQPGRFQIEASIAALHCEAPTWAETDWPQIVALYDLLVAMDSSPVVALNRAIALGRVAGPAAALIQVDRLARPLARYHLFHATRAAFLRELGLYDEAAAADAVARTLTHNHAEQALLEARLAAEP